MAGSPMFHTADSKETWGEPGLSLRCFGLLLQSLWSLLMSCSAPRHPTATSARSSGQDVFRARGHLCEISLGEKTSSPPA